MQHRAARRYIDSRSKHLDKIIPYDTCSIIEVIFLLMGTGYMLSYNALITPIDYYSNTYPHYASTIMYYIVPIHRTFLFLSIILMITPCCTYNHQNQLKQTSKSANRISWHLLITIPFMIIFVLLSIYPFLNPQYIQTVDQSIYFMILLIICSFCGFFAGIIQCAVTSFCNYLPSKYMKASISGQAMAGIIVCAIKIITKLVDESNYELTGKLYFIIAGLFNALCAVLFIGANNTKFVRYYMEIKQSKKEKTYISRYDVTKFNSKATQKLFQQKKLEQDLKEKWDAEHEEFMAKIDNAPNQRSRLLSDSHSYGSHSNSEGIHVINYKQNNLSYCNVFGDIKNLAIGTFIVMMVTFLYFPGLMLSIKSQYAIFKNGNEWLGIILITEYNIFDYIGRQFMSKWKWCITPRNIVFISLIRGFIVYPLFWVLSKGYIVSDIVLHVANIFGGLSNGYLICLMFIFLSNVSENRKRRRTGDDSTYNHISATIMTLALNSGILVGSVFAIIIEKYLLRL